VTQIVSRRRGQNTVEYLLMLTVVVGVVLVAGMLLKRYMPSLFGTVTNWTGGAAKTLSAPVAN
jgi:uncharacterized protein (UPF0333 family)